MYTEDCRPEASVNDPRRVERVARRASSAFLSLADMCDERSDEAGASEDGRARRAVGAHQLTRSA